MKTYCKPNTDKYSVELQSFIAATVEKTTRWDKGIPTEIEGDNYGTVNIQIYNGSDFDHFNGKGGGEEGTGNRSKGGLWDDDEDW
ncbi:MAG: hypothetical protein IJ562_09680 [Prevotella sp.]|nr:hypothetical protein [Prevotella sp.]